MRAPESCRGREQSWGMKDVEHFIRCEVDFRIASTQEFGRLAEDWVMGAADTLAPDLLNRVIADSRLPRGPLTSGAPCGPAFAEWGFVSRVRRIGGARERRTARVLDAMSAGWVAKSVYDGAEGLAMAMYALDSEGYPDELLIRAEAEMLPDSPSWARAWIEGPEAVLFDPASRTRWLRFMHGFAAGVDPSFGQISYAYGDEDTTALETLAGPPWTIASEAISASRDVLRGYDWLTICPAELTERLGGAAALRATNAFAQVEPLRGGGTWLLATENYEDYRADRVEAVWRALAPVLVKGTPRQEVSAKSEVPFRLVFRDAAEA